VSTAMRLLTLALVTAGLGTSVMTAPALANTTINVNTTFDPRTPQAGTCSLREAVLFADGAPEPECAPGAPSGTTLIVVPASPSHYFLSTGLDLSVTTGSVVIRGGGVGPLGTTTDGAGLTRVLFVGPSASVSLDGLTVTGGQTGPGVSGGCAGAGCNSLGGGGILNLGSLTLNSAAVTGNGTGDGGGGNPGLPAGKGGDGGGIDNAAPLPSTARGRSHPRGSTCGSSGRRAAKATSATPSSVRWRTTGARPRRWRSGPEAPRSTR
jgi:CSLREA domain-containing protein